MKGKGYRIDIASPPGYEELVALILINGEEVALLHKENGPKNLQLRFYEGPVSTTASYSVFLEALQAAKEELLK